MPELVSKKHLARLLDVSEEVIEKWKVKGRIPWIKMPDSKLVRYPLEEVRDWYLRGRVNPVDTL